MVSLIHQLVSLFATLALVAAEASPVVSDSPDVVYEATFEKTVKGFVDFSSTNGTVQVEVDISGLPSSGGPFLYHIHQAKVPTDGNCVATLGHFNPYNGSATATDAADKEAGDLSGKHGFINGTSIKTTYIDPYLSLNPDSESFFANLSVVIHYHNATRLACANILEKSGLSNTTSTASASATSLSSPEASSTSPKASSTSLKAGAATVAAGAILPLAAAAFLL